MSVTLQTKTDEKPLVTFAVFAYNQEKFIRAAIEGAPSQDYKPLQIILSDDCSSDQTYAIMRRAVERYSGPHELLLNRNPVNLGIGGHVNRIMELARGDLVVVAAGDDISKSNRTQVLCDAWLRADRKPHSLHSWATVINEEGAIVGRKAAKDVFARKPNESERQVFERVVDRVQHVMGATHAWSKNCFDLFGPLDEKVSCEDRIIPFRSLLLGGVKFVDDELVYWRSHGHNLSGKDEWIKKGYPYSLKVCNWDVESLRQYIFDIDILRKKGIDIEAYDLDELRILCQKKLSAVELRIRLLLGTKRRLAYKNAIKAGVPISYAIKEYLKIRFTRLYRVYIKIKTASEFP